VSIFLKTLKKASQVGAFFVACLLGSALQAACLAPHNLPVAQVAHVVDGDTIRLSDGRSVRLVGINAPELGHGQTPAQPFAAAARNQLQSLIAVSQSRLWISVVGKDHYGRTLAHLYGADGHNLEAELLAQGLGYFVAFSAPDTLALCQQQAEQQARNQHLGVWEKPSWLTAEQISESGFALLRVQVRAVKHNNGGVWLETAGPLVVHVPGKQLSGFDLAQLQQLNGKMLEVRGWVIDRSRRGNLKAGQARWLLQLTAPSMLHVISPSS
jgi:endonuclease YncB( thermonuclease family)